MSSWSFVAIPEFGRAQRDGAEVGDTDCCTDRSPEAGALQ